MLHFVLGIHCHQPVGNFDFVFESAHKKSYSPFLKILSEYPEIKCTLHYSGILYDWIKANKPETYELIGALAQKGQLEIMTGGYYEPILTTIPEMDRLGQIQKQTEMIEKDFNVKARGLWLTERIWEPHLAKSLADAGVEYVTVDDSHLKQSGISDEDMYQFYLTEELGSSVKVFPISEDLRYLIPFQEPEKTIEFLRHLEKTKNNQIVVLADDGEKFGDWPDTYEWVYEKKWLVKFFDLLMENKGWLKTRTFSEIVDEFPAKGKVYMATASYEEMMGWALPTDKALDYQKSKHDIGEDPLHKQFLRGGFWRNFLAKYPESNAMYSKMQYVSKKVNDIKDKKKKEKALDYLWQGQCNCAYWHGEFGGLYLNHLRNAIYKNLIMAEALADKANKEDSLYCNELDYNTDSYIEQIIGTGDIYAYFSEKGGQLIELDLKWSAFNMMDNFTRQKEHYHEKILNSQKKKDTTTSTESGAIDSIHDKEKKRVEGIEKQLIYDNYQRYAFIDHILETPINLEQFKTKQYKEIGNFIDRRYQYEVKQNKKDISLKYNAVEALNCDGSPELAIEKIFTIKDNEIEVLYNLKNTSQVKINQKLAIEFNFTVLAGEADDRYYLSDEILEDRRPKSQGITTSPFIGLRDEYQQVTALLQFDTPVETWRFPVETVSQSVDAYELNYQASCIVPTWDLSLLADESREIKFKLLFEKYEASL